MGTMEWPPTKAELVAWVENGEGWSIGPAPRDTVDETATIYSLLAIVGDYDNRQPHDDGRLNSYLDRLISLLALSAWGGDSIESRERAVAYIRDHEEPYESAVTAASDLPTWLTCYRWITWEIGEAISCMFDGIPYEEEAANAIAYCAMWQMDIANHKSDR